jgi:ACS family tartrate transporter-like MFS transporter
MYFAHNAIQGPLLALPTTFLKGKGAAAGLATINMVGILGGVIYPPLMGWIRDLTGSYQSGLVCSRSPCWPPLLSSPCSARYGADVH